MTALIRYLVVLLFALPVMGFVREAQAATIAVTSSTRSASTHPNNLNTTWISRADCLANDVISLALSVADAPQNGTFQVWASAGANDCKSDEIRKSTSVPVCGLVFETSSLGSTLPTVRLSDRDILFALAHPSSVSAQGKGTVADCAGSVQTNPLPQALTLWLMFTDVGGVADQGSIAAVQTKFALLGPNAPSGLTAGPGDTILKLDWDAAVVGTVASYSFFCDPKPGTEGDGGFVVVPLDATGTTTPTTSDAAICSDASTTDADEDDGGDGGDASTASDAATCVPASAVPEASSPAASFCGSGALVAGTIPDDTVTAAFKCGGVDSSSANTGLVEGLQNGRNYAVSVAAVDLLGNVGTLSSPVCSVPTPISDFFTVYRASGGTAGGSGFCSVAQLGRRARAPWAFELMALAGIVAVAFGRRGSRRAASAKCQTGHRC